MRNEWQALALLGASIGIAAACSTARAQSTRPEHFLPDESGDLGEEWTEDDELEDEVVDTRVPNHDDLISASLGFGGTWRLVVHADICDPDIVAACRFSPPHLQLQGGWSAPTYDDFQHGVGLGVATSLSGEGNLREGADAFANWVLSPRYLLRYRFDPWFQLAGVVGIPISFLEWERNQESSLETNWGIEIQVNGIFKFLTGFGVYAGVNLATYFSLSDSVWPTLSVEGGLIFDYEVLP